MNAFGVKHGMPLAQAHTAAAATTMAPVPAPPGPGPGPGLAWAPVPGRVQKQQDKTDQEWH